jgi:hypothetical protein
MTAKVVGIGGDYRASRLNATQHGILSRHVVLPWEDRGDYHQLLTNLQAEYSPAGPTERHLVETLASIMWRASRVIQAEAAAYSIGVRNATRPTATTATDAVAHLSRTFKNADIDFTAALTCTEADTAVELVEDRETADRAAAAFDRLGGFKELSDDSADAYQEAVALLTDSARSWWDDEDEPETAAALHAWLSEIVVVLTRRVGEIECRAEIRTQTIGTALDPTKLERLARYETHLDRKLERTIGMLMKLQDMRRTVPATTGA